jgi:DNA repair protein RadD
VKYTLRDYQCEAVDALWAYFAEHTGNPLLVLPTGAGKSVVQAAFVTDVLTRYPGQRFLLITHVRELVEQNAAKLEAMLPPMTVGVYSAGLNRRELDHPVTVASVQSLANALDYVPAYDLVIIDECHLVPPSGEGRYRTVLQSLRALNPHLKVIGMSATPYRLKSGYLHKGKGRIFTDVCCEIGVRRLIDAGYLSPLVSKSGASAVSLDGVRTRGGEFVDRDVQNAMDRDDVVEASLDEVMRYCADRKQWIVFAAGVEHAEHVLASLTRRGVQAELVTGATPTDERDATIARFKAGELRALVNVAVLTTGFDAPALDAVVLMRATKSPGLYYQMVGRGLRIAPGKHDCLVLDFGGNVLRHGPIDRLNVRERSGKKKGGAPPVRVCPECREVCLVQLKACPCGYVWPVAESEPHDETATDLPVLSERILLEVEGVAYSKHEKAGKPPSLRVTYQCGLATYSEWVCLEHDGYAARKAAQWWARRGMRPVPVTVDEALERVSELRVPWSIDVEPEGKYWRVVDARMGRAA